MSLIWTFILLTILGELGAFVYLAYAVPSFVRAHPLGPRRTLSFFSATVAIAPTIVFLVLVLLRFIDLFATHFGAPMNWEMYVFLYSLLVIWGTSLLCSLTHQEFFGDEKLRKSPIRAAFVSTCVITIIGGPVLLLGEEFSGAIIFVVFIAAITWHVLVFVDTNDRTRAMRTEKLTAAQRCPKCFYSVKDVIGGCCPECGKAIRKSLNHNAQT